MLITKPRIPVTQVQHFYITKLSQLMYGNASVIIQLGATYSYVKATQRTILCVFIVLRASRWVALTARIFVQTTYRDLAGSLNCSRNGIRLLQEENVLRYFFSRTLRAVFCELM